MSRYRRFQHSPTRQSLDQRVCHQIGPLTQSCPRNQHGCSPIGQEDNPLPAFRPADDRHAPAPERSDQFGETSCAHAWTRLQRSCSLDQEHRQSSKERM